jgi:hypothetical protein
MAAVFVYHILFGLFLKNQIQSDEGNCNADAREPVQKEASQVGN